MNNGFRIGVLFSDFSGCLYYRCQLPFRELKKFDVTSTYTCFLPRMVNVNEFETLVNMVTQFDVIIMQRCYILAVMERLRAACNFTGVPLVFETDDDYINLDADNPAFVGMVGEDFLRSNPTREQILNKRQESINEYLQLVSLADMVTVSTEELKRTLFPYNRNIEVFQNNVESVFEFRTMDPEEIFIQDGRVAPAEKFGVVTVPSHTLSMDKKTATLTPRIGYTGTPSHRTGDWASIAEDYSKIIAKHSDQCWFLYVGDPWFNQWHHQVGEEIKKHNKSFKDRNFNLPAAPYDLYLFHLRNLDIGLAPLAPTIFNMSKSDIKAVEYGMWGIPPLLPNYITYSRNWKHGETALLYNNGKEFYEYLELLINDPNLRSQVGRNALEYVKNNRLERQHTERRYQVYKELVDGSYKLKVFQPCK